MLKIENFPDEIFLEIFAFLSPIDLFESFGFLNERFDRILRDRSIKLGIRLKDGLPSKCRKWKKKFEIVEVNQEEIDLSSMSEVRCLTIGPFPRPTEQNLDELCDNGENFANLEELTIFQPLSGWSSEAAIRFWENLFSEQFSSNLKSCRIFGRIFSLPTKKFVCRSLKKLSIGGCSMRDLPILLSILPNVEHLSTEVWGVPNPTKSNEFQHFALRSARFVFKQENLSLEFLGEILSFVPELKRLEIESTRKHRTFSFENCRTILTNFGKNIEKFFISIYLTDDSTNQKLELDSIRRSHRFFSNVRLIRIRDALCLSNRDE